MFWLQCSHLVATALVTSLSHNLLLALAWGLKSVPRAVASLMS